MRCDDLRTIVAEGAPLEEAAREHLAACASCGEEFAELRALTSLRTAAPETLRERVLAGFPAPASRRWGLLRAAAILLAGLAIGFTSGYVSKPAREVVKIVPPPADPPKETAEKDKPPFADDYVSNVAIAAQSVYGKMVNVKYDEQIHVRSIVVDPKVKSFEQYCPVARQLGNLAEKLPAIVTYSKKEY